MCWECPGLLLWLGIAVIGLVGLLHSAYSRSRYYYLGFVLAVVAAASMILMLAAGLFL